MINPEHSIIPRWTSTLPITNPTPSIRLRVQWVEPEGTALSAHHDAAYGPVCAGWEGGEESCYCEGSGWFGRGGWCWGVVAEDECGN